MTSTTLKFGDLVIIQGLPQADPVVKKENKKLLESGFLSALGFTDNRIFLQTVPSEEKEKLKVASNLSNYHDLIFQIWPKVSYEAHKQLRKLNKEKAMMVGASDEALDAFEEKMRKVSGRVEQEKEANQLMLAHSTGLPAIYGNEIQLMHFNSKGFLTARVTCSDADSSAYKFEIAHEYNSGMAFKIIPRFQIRQEGDLVLMEDQVLLKSSKLDCYVNFTNDQHIEFDNRPAPAANLPSITAPFEYRQLNLGSKRYEAYISQFRDSIWRFYYYGDCKEEEEGVVKGGDLIKIRIPEVGADLAADVPMRGRNPEVYGRKYNGEYEEEENNVGTIWEVEIPSSKDRGSACQLKTSQGKPQGIRLRNLLTGKFLCIDEEVQIAQDLKKNIAVVRGDDQKKPSLAIFHPFTTTASKKLHYGISYGIGLSDEKGEYRFLQTHEKTDFTTRTNVVSRGSNTNVDHNIFKPLQEDELSTEKRVITCENKLAYPEHAFILMKVSDEEAYNARYIASSVVTLKYFRDLLKAYTNPQNISRDTFNRVLSVLKDLIFFVQKANEKAQEASDPVTFEGIPIQEKQRMFKDFRIIELLTEILYYPFYTKFFTLDNIRHKVFKKVFQYCYRLIKHTIKEYRPNEIYAAQWLEHYMEQAMNSNVDNDIKAEATLIELIDNNKRILNTKINKDMIGRFVNMLESNKSQKFVNLLRALCVCDGEAVVRNQTDMSRYIIEDVNVRNNLIYQHFKKVNGVIEVRVQDYEVGVGEFWITLSMFKKTSEDLDFGEKYNYFLSLIQLLSDLCLQRNYVALDYLQNIYTYDVCYTIISDTSDQELDWEIKSAFAKLLGNLWIDRKPYQPLNVPQYLILWDTLNASTCSQIACSESDVSIFEGLRGYLKGYFEKLAKARCTKVYEVEQNKFTLIMLELTEKMVRFGLYKDLNQMKDLIRPLLVLLNGMKDAMTQQEFESFKRKAKEVKRAKKNTFFSTDNLEARSTARYEENEETIIVMNCKNKICDIIKKTLDINDDLLLRKFLLEFRNDLELNNPHGDHTPDNNGSALSDNRFLFGRNSVSSPVKSDESELSLNSFPKLLNWVQKLADHNAIQLSALAPTNIVRVLFDLCLYQHDDLVNNAFEILYNTHSQRDRLIEMLDQVHILEDMQNKTAVISIEKDLLVLRELAETTEKWYGLKDPHSIEQAKNCTQLIKRLERYLVNDTIITKGSGDPDGNFSPLTALKESQAEEFAESHEDMEEDDLAVDSEFQKIFKHLKAYEPMIDIIKYEISSGEEEKTKQRAGVLKTIFRFLTKFVTGQKKSQNLLSDHMDDYLTLLKEYTSCGIENFVQEMFKGNRYLIKQFDKVETFSGNIMSIIRRLGVSNLESSKMLLALKSFMRVKKNVVKQNQTTILSLLTAKENSDIFLILDSDKRKGDIVDKLRTFAQQIEGKNKSGVIKTPGEIDYISSLLEIMAYTCDGKNAITESRSQTSWPLKDLCLLYETGKDCWLLKRSILLFVYHVYLDTEKEMKEGGDLHKILKGMIKDMAIVSRNYKREYNVQYHKGVIDNKIAQEKFYFGGLLPCLNDFLVKKFYAGLPNYSQLLKEMYQLLNEMKSLDINPDQRKEIISTIDKFRTHAPEVFNLIKQGSQADIGPLVEHHHVDRRIKRDTSGYGSSVMSKEENPKNMKLKIRLAIISQHKDFLDASEKEFKTMIKMLIHIEKIEANDIYSSAIPFSEVIQSLIKLVDVSETTTPKNLIMVGMKMFRRIIARENKKDNRPAYQWEGDDWMEFQKKIVYRQNQLCELGIVDMICNIMSQTNDTEIQNECLLNGIALLIGGNSQVQKKILEYTQNDAQNRFLCAMSDLIERNFYMVKKEMSLKNKEYLATLNEREEELRMAMKTPSPVGIDMKVVDLISPGSPTSGDAKANNTLAFHEKMQQEVDETTQALEILQIAYRLLQLFCEGHNLQLQDQLRVQKDKNGNESGKSQNFIAKTAYCFNTLIKQINVDSIGFCTQMLDFLIEATQGPCEQNQECLAKAKIINSCMDFLTAFKVTRDYHKQGFIEEEQIDKVNDATTTAMKLLNTLIEGVSKPDIVEEMSRLDFRFLVHKLAQEYQDIVEDQLKLKIDSVTPAEVTSKMNADSMTQEVLESFDVYILIVTLANASPKVAPFLKDTEDYTLKEKDALEFFRRNTGNIEILFNGQLLKVYFPIHSVCRYLTENTQKDFMMNVNRESPTEKINGLVNAAAEFIEEMKHMAYLQSQKFVVSQRRFNMLRDFSTLISIAINIIIISTYYFTVSDNITTAQIMGNDGTVTTINVLGYVQLATSSLMIVFWTIINGPIILTRKWGELVKESKTIGSEPESEDHANGEEEPDPEMLPLVQVLDHLNKKGPYDSLFNQNGGRNYGHFFVRLVAYWRSLLFLLSEGKVIWMVFYLAVSILGVYSEIIYCLHILDVVNRSETLKNVVRSITHNLKQLLLTTLLGVVLIYIYALIGFYFSDYSYFNGDVGDTGERACTSMVHCFSTTLNYGLRNGGGIGDSLTFLSYESSNRVAYFFRLIFDLSFFIVINVVFLKLIFGIIIDTFAELRDQKSTIDEDIRTNCFICNLDRYTFDKNGGGFENHTEKHHLPWNYLYFIYSLSAKDPTEFNGIESYVNDMLQKEDISWFPLHRALELEEAHE